MNLAGTLAETKMLETQLIREITNRQKLMNKSYINKSDLTGEENSRNYEEFGIDREYKIEQSDKNILELKEKVFKNKENIDKKNVEYGINILLQKVKFIKIELQHLTPDKYSLTVSDYDTSDRIKTLEVEKVKLLNKIMSKNHTVKTD